MNIVSDLKPVIFTMTFDDLFKNNIFSNCKQANFSTKVRNTRVCEGRANVDITNTHAPCVGMEINVILSKPRQQVSVWAGDERISNLCMWNQQTTLSSNCASQTCKDVESFMFP